MSIEQSTHPGRQVPEITLAWRLRIAIEDKYTPEEMADFLGVHRSTIYRWMNGEGADPRPAYVRQWALACEVDVDWLLTGTIPTSPAGGPISGERGSPCTRSGQVIDLGTRQLVDNAA